MERLDTDHDYIKDIDNKIHRKEGSEFKSKVKVHGSSFKPWTLRMIESEKDYLAHGTGIPRRNAPAKTHIKEEDKIFHCQHPGCGKLYAKASHLKAHTRRHTREKPFLCTYAGYGWKFSRYNNSVRSWRSEKIYKLD